MVLGVEVDASIIQEESPMLNDIFVLIIRYKLQQGSEDKWKWRWSSNDTYSTKVTHERLVIFMKNDEEAEKEEFKLLWNKAASLKIQVHAWRVLWEIIPTSLKLRTRNAFPSHANQVCVFCKPDPESVSHVLFICSFVYTFGWNTLNGWVLNLYYLPI